METVTIVTGKPARAGRHVALVTVSGATRRRVDTIVIAKLTVFRRKNSFGVMFVSR